MTMTTPPATVEIVLVEDNAAHVRLLREALRESGRPTHVRIARDGVEAMAMLDPATAAGSSPDLILLDLNLPRKDGREVLRDIKSDHRLKHIPVVVLTTSRAERDIASSYALGANAVVTKPVDFDRFAEIIRAVDLFWFQAATLLRPTNGHADLPVS